MESSKKEINIKEYRENQVASPIPLIERVSSLEVYLLDSATEKRKKRICGVQRRGMQEGYVCLNYAGKGTDHETVGHCDIHEQKEVGHRVAMWKQIREENPNVYKTIGEALDIVDNLESKDLSNIDENLKLLNALLIKHLNGENPFTIFESQHALTIIKEITKTIETKNKIESQLYVDPKKLEAFIHQIFIIIKRKATETIAHEILTAISNEVILPMDGDKDNKTKTAKKIMEKYGNVTEAKIVEERDDK